MVLYNNVTESVRQCFFVTKKPIIVLPFDIGLDLRRGIILFLGFCSR